MVTTNKSLNEPAFNSSNWDVPLNENFDWIDEALGSVTSLNATSGSTTLTVSQYRALAFNITGTLVGNVTYEIPAGVGGQWIVRNATSGAFTVTITSAGGGTSSAIAQGSIEAVYSDGTNIRAVGVTEAAVNALFADRDVIAGTALTGGGNLSADVTLNADQASATDYRTNVANKLLNPNGVWNAMAEVTLTDGATINWNMSSGFDFIVTLGGNRTLDNPTSTKVGQKGRLIIQQDGTGSRTVTWGSDYMFANNTAPTLSTAANAVDVLYYDVRASNYIIVTLAGRAFA